MKKLLVSVAALLLLSGCANTIGVHTAAPVAPIHARAPAVRHETAPVPVPAPMPAPAPAKPRWRLRLFH